MSYNLTNEQIKDTYQRLVQISGSVLVNGTGSVIPSVSVTASYATTASYAANVSSPDWSAVQNKPAGLISSSAQVNYPQISNIPAGIVSGSSQLTASLDQRYVLSGSISQADWNNLLNKPAGIVSSSIQVDYTQISNIPVGILSSSAQIASEISGAFDSTSGSLAGRVTDLENFSSSLDATYVTETQLANATGSFLTTGSIVNDTITLTKANGTTLNLTVNNVVNALTASYVNYSNIANVPDFVLSTTFTSYTSSVDTFSGSFSTRVTNLEQFSSSLDSTFATDAELTAVSGALASTITGVNGKVIALENKTLVSGSSQINYPNISNIPVGILSSSAQIASEISGAFDSTSGSLAGRVTTLEQFSSSLDANFVSETELANATGSFLATGSINNDLITLTKANGSTFDLLVNNVVNALTASFAYTASYALNTLSGSVSWDQVQSKPVGLVSSSTQINYPDISNIPTGIVSGSDQLTGSFDQRYVLSGSISQADWNNLLNKPAGIISSSVQVDYTQISNVPVGILSSSAQIATEISGAFDSTSGSLAGRVTNLEQFSSSLDATFATDAELTAVSSSLAGTITGVNGRLVILEGKTLLSSSAQIATEISGAFTSTSASLAGDITGLDTRLDTLEGKTLVSGSSQIILQDTTGNLSGSRIVGDVATALSASHALNANNAISSSYANNAELLDGKDSSIFATTGSNSFVGNQTITGNVNITGQLTASALTYPTVDGTFGVEVLTTDGSGRLNLQIPETLYEEVKNNDVVTLPKGTPVKVTGNAGNQALVVKADASNPSLMPASYILNQQLAPQAEGLGIVLGRIQNINTSTYTAGDIIYVAVGGGFTNVRPTGSAEVQPLGFPVNIHANGSGVIMNPGVSNGLPNLTAGHLWVGNNDSVPTTIASSSFAKVGTNNTFTGTQTFNNITVNGTGSFAYIQSVTGSAKIIGDAFIILNNDLPAEPFAGIKVIDSGSTNVTSSLLWDGANNHWIYENISGSTYGAAGFMAGPRSTDINNILYPTQYKVLRSQGGDHVYDSNITDNDTNVSITIPLSVTGDITSSAVIKATGGFEGNVTGNASTATTASYANYVEYVNVGNKPTLVSGSSQIDYTGLSNIPVGILSSSAQIATEISGAFDAASGSFSTRVTNLEAFSSSLDSTYATDAQLTSVSSSLASSITGVSGRVTTLEGKTLVSGSSQLNNSILTGMTISGSFSGSFQGDGSGLTGIVTSIAQSTTFAQTFTSVTSVTVTHNLDSTSPFVQVYDGNDELLIPQTVKITNNNIVTVTFSQSTSGKVVVAKAGHIISGSVLWNNLVGTPSGLVSSSAQVNLSQVTGTTFGSSTYTFPGSVIVTGSVYGEVENLTVASNTASINFSSGSFFILTVPSSSVTHVTATNVGLGQTVNLLVKQQATTGSLTFNSTFKFATGSAYTVSNAANAKDILTFVTLDETGSVYTSFVKRLV